MSLARVQKQLVRDLKRSPAKAAALGILCVVALYFWAPLVAGWFGKERPKATQLPEQAVPTQDAEVVVTSTVVAQEWHKVVAWRASDRRMQSAELGALASEPFGVESVDAEELDERTAVATPETQLPSVGIEELGLKLSSTMLGPNRRVAVINGRPYAEGGAVEINEEMAFIVARVMARSVWLERDGQRYELPIAK